VGKTSSSTVTGVVGQGVGPDSKIVKKYEKEIQELKVQIVSLNSEIHQLNEIHKN